MDETQELCTSLVRSIIGDAVFSVTLVWDVGGLSNLEVLAHAQPRPAKGEPAFDPGTIGTLILALADRPEEWIHRRVESVEFCDDKTVRRSVSVDFTLPDRVPCLVLSGNRVAQLVPLARLRKQALVGFDVFDEDGRSVPLLTAIQTGKIVADGLIHIARQIIHGDANRPLDETIEKDIRQITRDERGAKKARNRLLQRTADPNRSEPSRSQLFDLAHDLSFAMLIRRYYRVFLMVVQLEGDGCSRRILKFRCTEPFERSGGPWRLLVGEPDVAQLNVPAAQEGGYHLEIDLPSGVRVVDVSMSTHKEKKAQETDEEQPSFHERIVGSKIHLCVHKVPIEASDAFANAALRAARLGWFGGACFCAWLIAIVLGIGDFWVRTHNHISALGTANTGVTLLLVIPGVFATLLVRYAEHPMVAHLLRAIRLILAVSALLAYSAAGTLVLARSDMQIRRLWAVYALLAIFIAITITVGLLTPPMRHPLARLPIVLGGLFLSAASGTYLLSVSTSGPLWTATLSCAALAVVCLVPGFSVAFRTSRKTKRGDSR